MGVKVGIVTNTSPTDCTHYVVITENGIKIIDSLTGKELPVKEFILPNGITELDRYAFFNCEILEAITLPSSLRAIGERAFSGCKSLKRIVIPEGVTSIGAGAFSGCVSLEEIIFPSTIKEINYRALADCKKLKRVTIPEGVTTMEWAVFSGCESLESVSIPESIAIFGCQMFLNCPKLKMVNLPKHFTQIPDETFMGCSSLETFNFSDNITEIGKKCFHGCKKLVSFPRNAKVFVDAAFKFCRSLNNIVINRKTKLLPNSLFEGCINLTNISCDNSLPIGEKTFRSCIKLPSIPSFVTSYGKYSFENCISLEEVSLIGDNVPNGAFRGCKRLKRVYNTKNVSRLGSFAFSGCLNLEAYEFSEYVTEIPNSAFEGCKNLTSIVLPDGIIRIGKRAFYKCERISKFNLPSCLTSIGGEALKYCNSIDQLYIPANFTKLGEQAFSYMNSLKHLAVDPQNKTFVSNDGVSLIDTQRQMFILYANGSDLREYSLENYCLYIDNQGKETINPISGIGRFAFTGSNNLETLTLCSCTEEIEYNAFDDCQNLKTLKIKRLPLYSMYGIRLRDDGKPFFKIKEEDIILPFEYVEIDKEIIGINARAFAGFKKLKSLSLGNTELYSIGQGAFRECNEISTVLIPNCVSHMETQVFPELTLIQFENGFKILSRDFIGLRTTDDVKIYSTNNGTHYIEANGQMVKIKDREIKDLFRNSGKIVSIPELALKQLELMTFYDKRNPILTDGNVASAFTSKAFRELSIIDCGNKSSSPNTPANFKNCKSLKDHLSAIIPFSQYQPLDGVDTTQIPAEELDNLQKLLKQLQLMQWLNAKNSNAQNGIFIPSQNIDADEVLIKEFDDYSQRVIIKSGIYSNPNSKIATLILNNPRKLLDYIDLMRKSGLKNSILMNGVFIVAFTIEEMTLLIKYFDANMKRMFELSGVLDNTDTAVDNIKDLFKFAKILGVFEDNPITRQKACTFICDRIFTKSPNGEEIKSFIVKDDIHRKFGELIPRDEFDSEFVKFFMGNYQSICDKEAQKSGFMCRVYNKFLEISQTSTSDKGLQRHLLVTFKKCCHYLAVHKFNGVTEETEELAILLGEWFDQDTAFQNGIYVSRESQQAPRNIFTKYHISEEQNLIFDNNPDNDLKEETNRDFSYEWLPKQDFDNLLLGKYCNCCAHINGVGAGIMRASMVSPNHQNMVIRNKAGKIIGKSTVYVNREQNYAVFNNIESSTLYVSKKDLEKIYKAFMRGALAFFKKYNENNPYSPLQLMTIGTTRNTLREIFESKKNIHPQNSILVTPKYSDWSLNHNNFYNGDSGTQQRLVLKQ